MRTRYWLLAIVLAHLALGLVFAGITPYGTPGVVLGKTLTDIGAPDERAHVAYVASLASGNGLPVLRVQRPADSYEYHQPPLFYLLAAGWSKVLGVSDVGARSAGLPIRSLDVLFGCCTVVGAFFIPWWGLKRRDVGLCAASICALLPMQCAISGAVSNDPLLIALSTWVVAACARVAVRGWDAKWAVLIGLLTGLAFLTKSSALAIAPVIFAAWWVAPDRVKSGRWPWVALGVAVLVALPWWWRNAALYGDPLGFMMFTKVFKPDVHPGLAFKSLHSFGRWLFYLTQLSSQSFVGRIGYMHILLPACVYAAVWAVLGWLGYRWARAMRDRDWGGGRQMHVVCMVAVGAVFLAYLAFNIEYVQPQVRYCFPALASIAVGLAIGLVDWLKSRAAVGAAVLAVGLLAVDGCMVTIARATFKQNIAEYAVVQAAQARHPKSGAASGGPPSRPRAEPHR
jgi:4-amino-4-deoxy-L-arabinose transferase-like glycosyltransferase